MDDYTAPMKMRTSCQTHPLLILMALLVAFVVPVFIADALFPLTQDASVFTWIHSIPIEWVFVVRLFTETTFVLIVLVAYFWVFPSTVSRETAFGHFSLTKRSSSRLLSSIHGFRKTGITQWSMYLVLVAAIGVIVQTTLEISMTSGTPSDLFRLAMNPVDVIILVIVCATTAVSEELLFRGLAIPLLIQAEINDAKNAASDTHGGKDALESKRAGKRVTAELPWKSEPSWKSRESIKLPNMLWRACFVSAVLFGLLHIGNVTGAESGFMLVLLKIVQAFMFGFILSGIYVATRSLWPCIAIHFAFNMVYFGMACLVTPGMLSAGQLVEPFGLPALVTTVVLFLPAWIKALQWMKSAVIPYRDAMAS